MLTELPPCFLAYYQCGPASVNAIRNGEVHLNCDTGFIFAEVNADKVYWEVPFLFNGEMRAFQIDEKAIGKNISTLKPGTNGERRDMTRHYKHPEGTLSNLQIGWKICKVGFNRSHSSDPCSLYVVQNQNKQTKKQTKKLEATLQTSQRFPG